jgi:hypothetical protein
MVNYKNKHKGEDIYIIASGKSLDFIPKDFFNGKTLLGINQAFNIIDCKYYVRKEAALLKEILTNNACRHSHFFVSKHDGGLFRKKRKNKNRDIISSLPEANNVTIYDTINNIGHANILKRHINLDSEVMVASTSTISTAINIAAYMGAKNIILCGHDCKNINGECNASGYHSSDTYKIKHPSGEKGYAKWVRTLEKQTAQMKKILKDSYNINVLSINPFVSLNMEGNI